MLMNLNYYINLQGEQEQLGQRSLFFSLFWYFDMLLSTDTVIFITSLIKLVKNQNVSEIGIRLNNIRELLLNLICVTLRVSLNPQALL